MLCHNHYQYLCVATLAATLSLFASGAWAQQESDFNEINPDGSFSFGLKNNDFGGHYHEATGSPKQTVRGRFGSRNAESGRIEETVYTAGRRGFRARGPTIHRRMDLSQVPRGPIGTPDDPNADPYEDPSYGFGFQSPSYSRREDQDRFARLNGQYTYLDDVGERHLVRYTGSAQNGFDVLNSFPDSPNNVHYSRSLYRDPNPRARGRMSMQRKNQGQYSFISAGPDQRRSESVGPDGITRGSYSYLDDKGVQRTVQYIAGAGIGYRIVQTTTGSGTHNLPRPTAPQFGVFSPQSNDLPPESVAFDGAPNLTGFGRGSTTTTSGGDSSQGEDAGNDRGDEGGYQGGGGGVGSGGGSGVNRGGSRGSSSGGSSSHRGAKNPKYDENDIPVWRKPSRRGPQQPTLPRRPFRPLFDGQLDPNAIVPEILGTRPVTPTPPSPPQNTHYSRRTQPPPTTQHHGYDLRPTAPLPPSSSYPEHFPVNSVDFDKANIRAHVQNIDLLPISPRYPSPGDALKWDIITGN